MKYLCAICVRRDAYALHEIDGRDRPICRVCACEPIPDPSYREIRKLHGNMLGSPREKVISAVRNNPGATFRRLREVLDMPGGGCKKTGHSPDLDLLRDNNTYCKALERLVASGDVIRDGAWPNFTYRIADERRAARSARSTARSSASS
jgi:hypothetical protein